jgi:hypothetical protein
MIYKEGRHAMENVLGAAPLPRKSLYYRNHARQHGNDFVGTPAAAAAELGEDRPLDHTPAVTLPAAGGAAPLVIPFWRLLFALTAIAVGLVLLHALSESVTVLSMAGGLGDRLPKRFVNLDAEGNLPSWYSAMLWAFAALLAVVNGAHSKQVGRGSWHWVALAALFLLLSLDEAGGLHESIGNVFAPVAPIKDGFFSASWVFYGMALLIAAAVLFGKFVLTLPPKICLTLGVGALIFVAGALGAEMCYAAAFHGTIALPPGLTKDGLVMIEEFLEMMGVIVAIGGLLALLRDESGTVTVVR